MSQIYSTKIPLKKSLGQNFITNKKYIPNLLSLINKEDLVIEIGPGSGNITEALYKKTEDLILIEKDERFERLLKEKFPKAKIYIQDVLDFDLSLIHQYKVVGALPYYISKDIISKFLKGENRAETISVILQKEVAAKYTKSGQLLYNTLLIYADTIIADAKIAKENFYPRPKIDSQIIHIKDIHKYNKEDKSLETFIKSGYKNPRKKLKASIEVPYDFKDLRAHELSFEDWTKLFKLKSENR
ncbi:rRNA adenine N(6)-methyltransferase family protein [Patescibacteria group bacterium]|nr:rRNA adenine N(6)-methyltransferase family protein [Patescibacteria group bacterium]